MVELSYPGIVESTFDEVMTNDLIMNIFYKSRKAPILAFVVRDSQGKDMSLYLKTIKSFLKVSSFGERGIRTLGTEKRYNGLAISRLKPLGNLS